MLKPGDEIVFTGEEAADGFDDPPVLKLRLSVVEGGVTRLRDNEYMEVGEVGERFREHPHCKMFEAIVLEYQNLDLERTKEVFGLLFPDNFAIVVDSGPEDDYTNRRILAMIAVRQHERRES